ncbi:MULTISPECIES: glutamate ABC transporter substrate-binding protein [Actinomadura]|uniref:Glutamate transport system substrate-binding protein n=1 Tax=Actinomadura madurae TaxID=1993 RepID=A0A1I4WJI8_9ACTN|nr:glutamate ABC transporter substrate-binding protein [Actinomadura madurae]MCP9954574.1 glutamate ABC transporter substrate-binding protein [Actinomadura madurae]MCP9971309.1 glutamate ABC transporter substrate-binding protein [Actinomadura madurae]MCP9983799.1 glutamate ABC transporter substrate-binding protein [Actinomadura madurae]MCQ0004633.1 glutamate ABC transporter substrate-binding protein [Actinomadura madurae]MCQ0020038.1 glutamate ABC transporter substrate-binding protein [Actinom
MRVRRFGALIGAGMALSLALSACGSDTEKTEAKTVVQKAKDDKKLTIGIKFDQPALGLKKPDGTFDGFDVDVAKYIAKSLGVPESGITFKETTSANRESFLGGGQVDLVIATYSITDARKQQVTFGGPYYVAHQDTMVRTDDNAIKKAQDLKGKKLCKAAGSNSFRRVTEGPPDGKLNIKGVTLVDASSYSECVSKLKSKALDAVSTDDLILAGFANQQKGSFKVINDPFTDEKYGVGLKKGDTETCEAVNKAITTMYSDGTAKTLLEKHFAGTGLKLVTTVPQMEGCA